MKALTTEKDMNALRNYLLDHTIPELAEDLGVCVPTARRIASTLGDCEIKKREIKSRLIAAIKSYSEQIEIDNFGCSKVDNTETIRRTVLTDMIVEQLSFLDNDALLDLFTHIVKKGA